MMSTFMMGFITGTATAFGLSVCFMIFCVWFAKRHPLMPDDEDVLAAETTIYAPPSYGLSLNPRGKKS